MGCCFQTKVVSVSGEVHESCEESDCSDSLEIFLPEQSSCSSPSKILMSLGSVSKLQANIGFPELLQVPTYDSPLQSYYTFHTASIVASILSTTAVGPSLHSSIANPTLTEVTSQLFFGSFEDAKNEEELRSRAITHIISLIGPKHLIAGIAHMHHPMNDWGKTDLENIINNLWTFIEQSQRPGNALFIHCMWGQNRSATIMIIILMRRHGWSLREAFKILKSKRPLVQIHEQYAKQLAKIEQELYGRTSVSKNWMEIRAADMDSGKVVFFGDSIMSNDDQSIIEMMEQSSLKWEDL